MTPFDPLAVAQLVTDAIESLGGRYSIGGSMASAFAGEPRSTLDVDIVVDLAAEQTGALAERLSADFYVDANALRRAVDARASANVIHHESSIKIDLFMAGGAAGRHRSAGACIDGRR